MPQLPVATLFPLYILFPVAAMPNVFNEIKSAYRESQQTPFPSTV
jgi:hypothetical protein